MRRANRGVCARAWERACAALVLAGVLALVLTAGAPRAALAALDETDAAQAAADGRPEVAEALSYAGELGRDLGFLPSDVSPADAVSVSIARLASADESLDGKLVTFRGEVVGEPVSVTGGKWVQLQSADDSYVLVAMTDELASAITEVGSYQTRGTTLQVTGIFRLADPDRMGDMDVTAYQVRVVDPGGARSKQVNTGMLWVGLGFVALGGTLAGVGVYLHRRTS